MMISRKQRIRDMREVMTKIARIMTGSGIGVTCAGSKAYVQYNGFTPVHIYIPSIPDDASDELLDALQGFIDHELAHVIFTDPLILMEADQLKVASWHNAVEDCYIESKIVSVYKGTGLNLERMRRVFLDRYIQPGISKLIKEGNTDEKAWFHELSVVVLRAYMGQQIFIEYMDEGDKWSKIAGYCEKLVKAEIPERLRAMADSRDALRTTVAMLNALYGKLPEEKEKPAPSDPSDEESDEEGEPSESGEGESSDEPGTESGDSPDSDSRPDKKEKPEKEEAGEELESEEDGEDAAGDEEEAGEESGESEEESEDEEEASDEEAAAPESASEDDQDDSATDTLGESEDAREDDDSELPEAPEYSESEEEEEGDEEEEKEPAKADFSKDQPLIADPANYGSPKSVEEALNQIISEEAGNFDPRKSYVPFSEDFDTIEPMDAKEVRPAAVEEMEAKVKQHVSSLQRDLSTAFLSKNKAFWVYGKKKGKLAASKLARLSSDDPKVFRQKTEITTGKAACTLLIDASGSMSGSKVKLAAEVAWALSESMCGLKIPCEVLTFTTGFASDISAADKKRWYEMVSQETSASKKFSRYEPTYMNIVKEFTEQVFSPTQRQRLTKLGSGRAQMANNCDGDSLIQAARRLSTRKESNKILIVLSDGQPAADGYGDHADRLKYAVEEVVKAGIQVFGVGIMDSTVTRYYPHHAVASKLEDLPVLVMHKLKDMLLRGS